MQRTVARRLVLLAAALLLLAGGPVPSPGAAVRAGLASAAGPPGQAGAPDLVGPHQLDRAERALPATERPAQLDGRPVPPATAPAARYATTSAPGPARPARPGTAPRRTRAPPTAPAQLPS